MVLEDREEGGITYTGDDTPIKGMRLDREEAVVERLSSDTEEIRFDEGQAAAARVVPTASITIPTVAPIFATATTITPYTRRKGKEKMLESETPKKKKIQEQINVQLARELEEEMERDA
nr:hypothetical protein [Tanacetum cinerariifolium]